MRFFVTGLALVLISCAGPKYADDDTDLPTASPSTGTASATPTTQVTGTPTGSSTTGGTTTSTGTTTTDTAVPHYELEITLTADDAWELWVDGVPIDQQVGWSFSTTSSTTVDLNTDGPHVVAVHAYDAYGVIAGFLAEVKLDGVVIGLTGNGSWKVSDTQPPPDWVDPWFDDSTWGAAPLCTASDLNSWGGQPATLLATGAQWVWPRPCRDLGDSWFRLPFVIAP